MDKKILGNYIRIHRKNKGLTQAELAEKVKVSPNLIGYYERGNTAPSLDVLFELAHILDFSIDALINNAQTYDFHIGPNEIDQILNQLPESKRRLALKATVAVLETFKEE